MDSLQAFLKESHMPRELQSILKKFFERSRYRLPCIPKCWTHQTMVYNFCNRSVREKAWRSCKRVAQAT